MPTKTQGTVQKRGWKEHKGQMTGRQAAQHYPWASHGHQKHEVIAIVFFTGLAQDWTTVTKWGGACECPLSSELLGNHDCRVRKSLTSVMCPLVSTPASSGSISMSLETALVKLNGQK